MDPETLKVLITSGGPLGVLVFLVIVFLWFIRDRDSKYENSISILTESIKKLEKAIEELNKRIK